MNNTTNIDNTEEYIINSTQYPNNIDTNVEYLKKNKEYIIKRYIHNGFRYLYDFELKSEYIDEFNEHIYQGIIKLFESELWDIVSYTLFRLKSTVVYDWDYIDSLCIFMDSELLNYEKIFNTYLIDKKNRTDKCFESFKHNVINTEFQLILDKLCIQEFMMNIT